MLPHVEKNFLDKVMVDVPHFQDTVTLTAYPVSRCPQGCFFYPENDFGTEVDLITIDHWLEYVSKGNFNWSKSDSRVFIGKNPTWPSVWQHLWWKVGSSIILDEEYGLSIISCAKKIHSSGKNIYVFPVKSPFGSHSEQTNDDLSPVCVTPKISRLGRTTVRNASHTVFREHIGAAGMSSFGLNPKPLFNNVSVTDMRLIGFALENREDLVQMFSTNGGPFQTIDKMMQFLESYRSNLSPSEHDIKASIASGTVISKEDAVNMYLMLRN